MTNNQKNLPSDATILQVMVRDLLGKNASLLDNNASLLDEIQYLKGQLELLKKKLFGQSSEKLKQLIADIEARVEENEVITSSSEELPDSAISSKDNDKKNKPKRKPLPDHLPREEIILAPEKNCPDCGKDKFRKITDDISETLEYIPASFKVIRHIRPRLSL